ncbi:right-handed parallel beta-helix repeat-containing protein [Candidatus Omnitrophota bacterium]
MKRKALVTILVIAIGFCFSSLVESKSNGPTMDPQIEFEEKVIGDKFVEYHMREIDGIIVEKDYIVKIYDNTTKQLLEEKRRWREDLPKTAPTNLIAKKKAESMVEGEVQFSKLYYISPETDVFPLEPIPTNPCWIVRSQTDEGLIVTIIDAVKGRELGRGVPPPSGAYALSGPQYTTCVSHWDLALYDANSSFDQMGYSTVEARSPSKAEVMSYIKSYNNAVFYEIAHGASYSFANRCNPIGDGYEYTTSSDIKNWISDYPKVPFSFLYSCDGMCSTSEGSLSYELRKGSEENTATVGGCGLGEEACDDCMVYYVAWQSSFLGELMQGETMGDAFNNAQAANPVCSECYRFAGDANMTLVPIVSRTPLSCGDTVNSDAVLDYSLLNCSGQNGLIIGQDNITLDCNNHTIQNGNMNQIGIDIQGRENVTVINCNIEGFEVGINLENSNGVTLQGNQPANNTIGINLANATNNTIADNISCNNVNDLFCSADSINNSGELNYVDYIEGCSGVDHRACGSVLRVPDDFETIQEAIDAAYEGQTVLVSEGVYAGLGNRDITFGNKNIVLKAEGLAENTIMNCQGTMHDPHLAFMINGGQTDETIIDGFTVINGHYGMAAVHIEDSYPVMQNNIFRNNSGNGTASYVIYDRSNLDAGYGYPATTIRNNVFRDNFGGVFYIKRNIKLYNNIFANNSYCGVTIADPPSEAEFVNNTIVGNQSKGVRVEADSSTSDLVIRNSIIYGNNNSQEQFTLNKAHHANGDVIVSRSVVENLESSHDPIIDAGDNIFDAPLFVDPDDNNYELDSFSPGIDAADYAFSPPFDMKGSDRFDDTHVNNISGSIVDIGALERTSISTFATALVDFYIYEARGWVGPVEGAVVKVFEGNNAVASGTTDSSGHTILDLNAGNLRYSVSHGEYSREWGYVPPFTTQNIAIDVRLFHTDWPAPPVHPAFDDTVIGKGDGPPE